MAGLVYGCGTLRLGLIRWAEVVAIADSLPGAPGGVAARAIRALSPLAHRIEGGAHHAELAPPGRGQ